MSAPTASQQWANWAGDETCGPRVLARPTSTAEAAELVTSAVAAGDTLRVVGAGHSFNDQVCTDGTLLSLDALSGIQHVDPVAGLVTVGAGTRLSDLNRDLAGHGLALRNLGDIDTQSVAGAMSTATHGTGRRLGNLATQIHSLELVLADGSVLTCTEDDPETLRAARVSLGALGVITAYTLRVVPAFALHAQEHRMPLSEVLGGLDDLADGNDHFEFFLFPHAEAALVKRNNRTDQPIRPPGRLAQRLTEFVENAVVETASRVGRRAPAHIPRLNRLLTALASGAEYVDASHRVFASMRAVRFTEMEWAVPRAACSDVVREILATVKRERLAVGFPLEVRFVAPDEQSFLSPSYGRETAYVAVHMYRGMEWEPYFRHVQEIASAHEGRPHWGKRHFMEAADLAERYPAWEQFQSVRRRLDPQGTFTNAHLRRVLGPVGSDVTVAEGAC